ncbi:MAG: aminotransferase [Planctomycetota bacterium]
MSSVQAEDYNTQQLWQRDNDHFLHPYTNFAKFAAEGSTIYTRGKDHFIYDSEGREYLDGIAGLWCVNIGHGRQEIANCMAEQCQRLAYYNTFEDASSPPAAELAAKLSELSPGTLRHVFYGTGGSMANDTAIKIAHYYFNLLGKPNKKQIISRDLAYHGSTYMAHALTGIRPGHIGFDLPTPLVHYLTAPYPYRRPEGMSVEQFADHLIDELEQKIIALGPDNVSCFIAEPILGAGGVIVPPAGYQKRTWEVCKKYEVLYISDEVVTGFGRLGEMLTSEKLFGVQPDLLVLAKGISSGYIPLGATMLSDEIYSVISQPKPDNPYFSHGFTYSGHALACAVGLKNIEIMEREDLCGHVRQWGGYFQEQLQSLSDLPIVGEVRGSHYMQCLEYVTSQQSKQPFADDAAIGKRVALHAKNRGLIVRPIGSFNVLSPPLTFDQKAIDRAVTILRESIEATMGDLRSEGFSHES